MTFARRHNTLLLLALLIGINRVSPVCADDFGYWEYYTLRYLPARTWEMDFFPELIYDQDGSQMSYLLLHAVTHYNPSSKLDIGFDYAYVRARTTSDRIITQQWLSPEVTIKQNIWGLPLSLRNKMEVREMHGATDRYRGKIGGQSPVAFTSLKITPYVSYELFYDFKRMAANQTRAIVGISIPIDARIQLNVFYLCQGLLEAVQWRQVNYVGSDIRILLGPRQ